MAYRPIFRIPEEDIERRVDQKLAERTKTIEDKIEERTKPLQEMAKTYQEERQEKLKERQERERQEQIEKLADERANKLAEERANKLAEERANKLAEEKAKTLAEERAKVLAEEKANKLAEEKAKTLVEERANKLAEDKANKLAEEKAKTLAEERAKVLAEENTKKIREELEKKFKEEQEERRLKEQQTISTPIQQPQFPVPSQIQQASTLAQIPPQVPQIPPVYPSQVTIPQQQQQQPQGPSQVTQAEPQIAPSVQTPDASSSKIAKMIEEIKKRKAQSIAQPPAVPNAQETTPQTPKISIPIVSPADVATEPSVSCPTCHSHVHALSQDGLTYKCTGPECGKEFVMTPKDSDYKCTTCGVPLKKPEEGKNLDSCPFCAGKKAVKFDWSKLWKIQKPSSVATAPKAR